MHTPLGTFCPQKAYKITKKYSNMQEKYTFF